MKKVCMVLLIFASFFLFDTNGNAMEYMDVLLKNPEEIEKLLYGLKQIDSSISYIEIPEIGLVRIDNGGTEMFEEIVNHELIESIGQLSPIYSEGINVLQTGLPHDELKLPFLMENQRVYFEETDLFDQLSWHKSMITNEGASIELSTGAGVRIALIDSGVDLNHPILSTKIDLDSAVSFVPDEPYIQDMNSHGTSVAGVIAQIAPDAIITPYKVLSSTSGDSFWALQAIIQAVNDGQDILNMSFGTYKTIGELEDDIVIESFQRAVDYALDHSVLLVSSSGNIGADLDILLDERGTKHLPSSIEGVLSTSGITRDYQLASYSNIGSNNRFTAPGGDMIFSDGFLELGEMIYVLYPTTMDNYLESIGIPQGYSFTIGTSLAAPAISAILAKYQSYHLNTFGIFSGNQELIADIIEGALSLDGMYYSRLFGYGLPQIMTTMNNIRRRIPPSAIFLEKIIEVNEPVEASTFITNISSADGLDVTVSYGETPDFSKLGVQEVIIILEDSNGNSTKITGSFTIQDTSPPTAISRTRIVKQFSELYPEMFVTEIHDNHDTSLVTITFVNEPSSEIVGEFEVDLYITDFSGNRAMLTSNLIVVGESDDNTDNQEFSVDEKYVSVDEKYVSVIENTMETDSQTHLPYTSESKNQFYLACGVTIVFFVSVYFIKHKGNK
ncbi:S8 family peptidase [Enterococcus casseliflavus]|uniref:S8 family peptidase n=1 Tax=Enterococcus casseliflavus TaxID=37734 RepID=UPI0034D3204C